MIGNDMKMAKKSYEQNQLQWNWINCVWYTYLKNVTKLCKEIWLCTAKCYNKSTPLQSLYIVVLKW